jgi:hypothetical protein
MDNEKLFKLIPQVILVYSFLAIIFLFFRDIFIGSSSLSFYLVLSFLFVLYVLTVAYFLWNKKFLPLFSVETSVIKEKDALSSQITKLKNEIKRSKIKIISLEGENLSLRNNLASNEKRLKGEYRFAFYYNSEEHEKLTKKIRDMLDSSKGKQVRIISLLDGNFKEQLIDSLKDGNLKVLIRKIGSSNNIQTFCEKLNYIGKDRGWVCKHNEEVHGRMIIIGNEEMMVMTSDILRDMCDKTDFGLWTNDSSLVSEGVKIFDRIYSSKTTTDYIPKPKK